MTRAAPERSLGRRGARAASLQILYQWEIGGAPIDATIEAYWAARDGETAEGEAASIDPSVDRNFAGRLARGTAEHLSELDPRIEAAAENWRLSRIAVIDRLILRQAAYELGHDPETPSAVEINEALELARSFSGEEAVKFVNGVLDAVARGLRE
jgi:N utilization substance protein B